MPDRNRKIKLRNIFSSLKSLAHMHMHRNIQKQMDLRFVTGFVTEFVTEFVTGIK